MCDVEGGLVRVKDGCDVVEIVNGLIHADLHIGEGAMKDTSA